MVVVEVRFKLFQLVNAYFSDHSTVLCSPVRHVTQATTFVGNFSFSLVKIYQPVNHL